MNGAAASPRGVRVNSMVAASEKPTVLVVDDHRFSRTVLTRILSAAEYDVEVCEDGERALEWLESNTPAAFVLDAEMPGMDGIELCWRLREDPRFRTAPILVSTANEDRYLLRAAFTAGCDDFLVKPLEPLVVVARLGSLLKKAQYYQELEEIRHELSRYVSPRIRKLIERQVSIDAPTGNEPALMDACILFSDIRGFTALSRTIDPTALFQTVSDHLGSQVDCVYRHQGYVDKFGGDGLMAIFDGESMASDACNCAIDIMERVNSINGAGVGHPVPLGIGIHAGPVVVGNIGSGEHLDYTAIGDTVNIAARLCGQAEAEDIIVSEAVQGSAELPEGFEFADPAEAAIRGLDEPFLLYHLRERRRARRKKQ